MTVTKTFAVRGMHCVSCAAAIEKALRKRAGVSAAEVNYGAESARISYDEERVKAEDLASAVEPLGYALVDESAGHGEHHGHDGMAMMDHAGHHGVGGTAAEKQRELAKLRGKARVALPMAATAI
ncbi:MAG: heavy metal-associated domain-containing protein, partial [Opitutales bacterium]